VSCITKEFNFTSLFGSDRDKLKLPKKLPPLVKGLPTNGILATMLWGNYPKFMLEYLCYSYCMHIHKNVDPDYGFSYDVQVFADLYIVLKSIRGPLCVYSYS